MGSNFLLPLKNLPPTLEMPLKKKMWRCFAPKKDVENPVLGVVVDDDVGDCDSVPQCANVAKNHAEGMKC